jgi:hypothetical protein
MRVWRLRNRCPRGWRPRARGRDFVSGGIHRNESAKQRTDAETGGKNIALRGDARYKTIEQRHSWISPPRFARGIHEHRPSCASGSLEARDLNPRTPLRSDPSTLIARVHFFGSWQVFRLRVARPITFPPNPLQIGQWLCFRSTVPGCGTNPLRRRARGGIGEKSSPHLTSLFTRPVV